MDTNECPKGVRLIQVSLLVIINTQTMEIFISSLVKLKTSCKIVAEEEEVLVAEHLVTNTYGHIGCNFKPVDSW